MHCFSRAEVMQCTPREENFEPVRQPHLRKSWPESSTGIKEQTLGRNSLLFAVHCRGIFKHTEAALGKRELDVVRPCLLKSSTSAPPLALFRFHYPRAYLTTSARPHTSLDSLDSYQTLSNPQTNAIASTRCCGCLPQCALSPYRASCRTLTPVRCRVYLSSWRSCAPLPDRRGTVDADGR